MSIQIQIQIQMLFVTRTHTHNTICGEMLIAVQCPLNDSKEFTDNDKIYRFYLRNLQ